MKRSQLFCLYLIFVFLAFGLCPMGLVSAFELSNEEQDYLLKKKTITFVSQTHYPPL